MSACYHNTHLPEDCPDRFPVIDDRPKSWNGHRITYDDKGNADISDLCEGCSRDYQEEHPEWIKPNI